MRRADFDMLIEAVAATAEVRQVVVVGSQSILASIPEDELPREATLSPEIDVVMAEHPRAGAVRQMLGPGSLIDREYLVYVDVVSETTTRLPIHWDDRAVHYRTGSAGIIAVCPEIHDLALAKLGAGRIDKDIPYLESLLEHVPPLLELDILLARLPEMAGVILDPELARSEAWIRLKRAR